MIKHAQGGKIRRRVALNGNGEVLKSEEKALMINEELLKGNGRVLKDNEEVLNGSEEAY